MRQNRVQHLVQLFGHMAALFTLPPYPSCDGHSSHPTNPMMEAPQY